MTTKGAAGIAACSFCAKIGSAIGRRCLIESGSGRPRRLAVVIIVTMAALLALGGHSVFAQLRIVGAISGTVQDPNGAVIPKAKVVLKDSRTAITKETVATEAGSFLFPDLAIGLYEVTV